MDAIPFCFVAMKLSHTRDMACARFRRVGLIRSRAQTVAAVAALPYRRLDRVLVVDEYDESGVGQPGLALGG